MLVSEGTMRFTLDGTDPTTTTGLTAAATTNVNDTYIYESEINHIKILGAVAINVMC
jgi:hypothetical protein